VTRNGFLAWNGVEERVHDHDHKYLASADVHDNS
jgi:hypothetical protein